MGPKTTKLKEILATIVLDDITFALSTLCNPESLLESLENKLKYQENEWEKLINDLLNHLVIAQNIKAGKIFVELQVYAAEDVREPNKVQATLSIFFENDLTKKHDYLVSFSKDDAQTKYDLIEKPMAEGLAGVKRGLNSLTASVSIDRAAAAPSPVFRLLIAEDNALNQAVLKRLGTQAGFNEITVAENGLKAVDAYAASITTQEFACILMDIQMPEMDGFEASQRIFDHANANNKKVTLIFQTADTSPEGEARRAGIIEERTREGHVVGILHKPLSLGNLKVALQEAGVVLTKRTDSPGAARAAAAPRRAASSPAALRSGLFPSAPPINRDPTPASAPVTLPDVDDKLPGLSLSDPSFR